MMHLAIFAGQILHRRCLMIAGISQICVEIIESINKTVCKFSKSHLRITARSLYKEKYSLLYILVKLTNELLRHFYLDIKSSKIQYINGTIVFKQNYLVETNWGYENIHEI